MAAQFNPMRVACTVLGHRMSGWTSTGDQRGAVRFCLRCHETQGWSLHQTREPAVPTAGAGAVVLIVLAPILAVGVVVELISPGAMEGFIDWVEGFAGA